MKSVDLTPAPLLVLLFILGYGCTAVHASPIEIYGFDGRSVAMGNAMTAASDDYTSAFYNPARIASTTHVVAGAGWMTHIPRLGVQLERYPEDDNDLPVYPENRAGITVGGLFPLGPRLDDRVALSIAAYVPVGPMLEGDLYAPSTPQFYRYQGRANKFVALAAVGIKVTEWLRVGAGIQGLADLIGEVNIRLRLSDRSVSGQDATVSAPFKVAPTAGLVIGPVRNLTLGLSRRHSIQLDFDVPSAIELDEVIALDLRLAGTTLFTPSRMAFGFSYTVRPLDLLVTADTVWTRWSTAPDPSLNVKLDASGELLDGLGLDERLDVNGSAPVRLSFKDTWAVRSGLEHMLMTWLSVRAGYAFEPSPAPSPIGAYNYLDPSSHRLSVGTGFMIRNPISSGRQLIHIDFAYAITLLDTETVEKKAGPIDRVGSYRADGQIHVLALTLRHEI